MWQEIIRHHRDKLNHSINQYTVKSLLWQLLNGLSYLHRSEQLLNLNLARVFFFFFCVSFVYRLNILPSFFYCCVVIG